MNDLYEVNSTGRCPHCKIGVRFELAHHKMWDGGTSSRYSDLLAAGKEDNMQVLSSLCPENHKSIVVLYRRKNRERRVL